MEIRLMGEAQFAAFLQSLNGKTVEEQVKLYIKLREGKSGITKFLGEVEAQYKEAMATLENHLLAAADAQNVTGFTVKGVGTTYTAETKKITIADDNAFFGHVLAAQDLDFFERRVSSTHVDEVMKLNGGVPPPGLNIFRERVMRVRKASEKAT